MAETRRVPNWVIALIPFSAMVIFGGFLIALQSGSRDELPSALVGRSAPGLALPPLGTHPAPGSESLTGNPVTLVNFWASWCAPCRIEHPKLMALAAEGVAIVGVNYKDAAPEAEAFLTELGNPYTAVGVDPNGRTGIDWGIYGVPETFVIGADGTVLLRHPGPVTERVFETRLRPAIEAAITAAARAAD